VWTPEYFVRLVPLPRTVDGVVVPNDDGTFDIYLNARQTRELQQKWLQHEINHIREDHFYRALSIVSIEQEAEGAKVVPENDEQQDDKVTEFNNLEHLLNYYRDDPKRIARDYSR
jgi:hypothetical protein